MQLNRILQPMKRRTGTTLRGYLVLLAVVGCCFNTAVAANEIEWMPDEHLRAAVRKALSLAPDVSLTPQALEGLTELEAGLQEIIDLKGLEHATRLETLKIFETYVIDLTPLAQLTQLRTLDLGVNGIVDVTPLLSLTGLKALDLRYNEVVDITPLAQLTDLEQLNLQGNDIVDITPLGKLTQLQTLDISFNEVVDITPLENLTQLKTLDLETNPWVKKLGYGSNEVVDITPLGKLTDLEQLNLQGNKVTDITALLNLTGLKALNLEGNQVVDITPLANLTELETLSLSSNEVVDITPLAQLTQLTTLNLYCNQVTDITPLANLTELQELSLSSNEVVDITPLAQLTQLTTLNLYCNQVTDITPLAQLTRLRKLELEDNPIRDVTPLYKLRERNPNLSLRSPMPLPEPDLIPDGRLAEMVRLQLGLGAISPLTRETLQGLTELRVYRQVTGLTGLQHATQLEELYLSGSGVRDITPLANLTKLKKLDLKRNQVVSLTPLATLIELEELYLSDNEISDIRPLVNLAKLKKLYLDANQIVDIQALTPLTELELLDLSNNRIRDITPLANFKDLEILNLRTNQISDSSVFAQLTNLKGLYIQSNPIQDVTPLRTLLKSNPKMRIDVGFMGKSPCPLMYWIDMERGTLHYRFDDPVVNLLPDIQNATTLALNGFEYYWTETTDNNTWRIRHARGQNGPWQVRAAELTSTPLGMAIAERKLYVSVASGKILRIPTNVGCYFGEPNFDFITGLASPEHLVVNTFDKNLYWTEKTPDGMWSIRSAPLDGSTVQSVRKLESAPLGFAIDVIAGQLYVSVASGKILRLRVDGSDFEPDFITRLTSPGSLGVDVGGGKVYWTEEDSIWRASLNGENIERVVPDLGTPTHLVLDVRPPTPAEAR